MAGKERRGRAVRAAAFSLLVLLLAALLTEVLRQKDQESLSPSYYRFAKTGCDVLFVGNSLMMHAVYPMELYERYGFTGFNLGTGGQSLAESFLLIREGIERFHPRLIVLDTTQLIVTPAVQKIAFVHYLTDNMQPLSRYRLELIGDMSRRMGYSQEEAVGLLCPLYRYHDRWQELMHLRWLSDPKKDTLGAKITARTYEGPEKIKKPHEGNAEAEFNPETVETLREILAFCREQDTEICLVSIPLLSMKQKFYNRRVDAASTAGRIAGEYGFSTLSLIDKGPELGMEARRDTQDGIHLNASGAETFMEVLGSYLHAHYDLPDHRDEEAYAFMEELKEAYHREKDKRLRETEQAEAAG